MKRKREFERSRRSFSYSNTSLYSVSLWWTETFLIGSPLCFCWTDCPSDRPAVLLPVWFCPPGFAARRWVTISFWQSVWSRRGRRWSVEKTGCHKPDTAVSPHFPSVLRRLCAVEAAAVSSLTKFAENKEQWLQNSDFRISHKNTNDKDNAFFLFLAFLTLTLSLAAGSSSKLLRALSTRARRPRRESRRLSTLSRSPTNVRNFSSCLGWHNCWTRASTRTPRATFSTMSSWRLCWASPRTFSFLLRLLISSCCGKTTDMTEVCAASPWRLLTAGPRTRWEPW